MPRKLAILWIVSLFCSCVATDVGNPQIETEVEFAGYESEAPEPTALTLENGIEVEQAWIKLRGFRLDNSANCDDTEAGFDGAITIDLLTGEISEPKVLLNREAGDFCRLRMQFTSDDVDGEPDELAGNSVFVSGTLVGGNPFTAVANFEDELALTGDFTLAEGSHLLQVGFFLNEWIDSTYFETVPDLDPDHSEYETFRSNVGSSARLFHDANRDGELDTEEIARSLATSDR